MEKDRWVQNAYRIITQWRMRIRKGMNRRQNLIKDLRDDDDSLTRFQSALPRVEWAFAEMFQGAIRRGSPIPFAQLKFFLGTHFPKTAAIWKIGRYMAMTNAPIADPIKTIKRGSSSEVRADTAASTSSS